MEGLVSTTPIPSSLVKVSQSLYWYSCFPDDMETSIIFRPPPWTRGELMEANITLFILQNIFTTNNDLHGKRRKIYLWNMYRYMILCILHTQTILPSKCHMQLKKTKTLFRERKRGGDWQTNSCYCNVLLTKMFPNSHHWSLALWYDLLAPGEAYAVV